MTLYENDQGQFRPPHFYRRSDAPESDAMGRFLIIANIFVSTMHKLA